MAGWSSHDAVRCLESAGAVVGLFHAAAAVIGVRQARLGAAVGLILPGLVLPGWAVAQIAPCPTSVAGRPAPVVVPAPPNAVGCERGVGFKVGTTDLFRCQVMPAPGQDDIPEGSPEYVFLLDRPGHDRVVLPDSLMAGRFEAYEVLTVDLDVDGRPEHVLAAWNAQGNGIGVNRWTIRVFAPDWTPIATFEDVADWGDSSLVAAPDGRPGCDLAVTGFVDHVDARGRPGIAFRARFHRLQEQRMIPAADRPALTRRYDFAFQRERIAHFQRHDEPITGDAAAWLSHPSTQAQ